MADSAIGFFDCAAKDLGGSRHGRKDWTLRHSCVTNVRRSLPWLRVCAIMAGLSITSACERLLPAHNMQDRQAAKPDQRRLMINCKPNIDLDLLRKSNGRLEDVRIFRFSETILYIPTKWLGDLAITSDISRFQAMRPILVRNECAGIVHDLTDGVETSARYVDISIDLEAASDQIIAKESPTYISFWKMRKTSQFREGFEPTLKFNRLIDSKDHRTEDSFIRVLPDIGVRLNWRPVNISEIEWRSRINKWRAPARGAGYLPKPNEIGAWGQVVDTPEWQNMAVNVRSLVQWLSMPPANRNNKQQFILGGEG